MDPILSNDATDLRRLMTTGALSAEDLMAATLDQIATVNGTANAIVSLRPEDALLDEARACDQTPKDRPLSGLPIAVKDLANVAGLPTSMGSPLFAGQVAHASDIMVQRMQDAGAIVIGKTNTPEFGLGSHTYNPVHGATQNAILPGMSAGGSSGGAAVALALNMVSIADGSDMMGSLRNPAGWNGVYGMRPTWGLVPSEPVGDTFLHQLSTNGPMARTPRDLALLLSVQSGADPRQPHGLPRFELEQNLEVDIKGARIGWLADWGGAYLMEEGVINHCEAELTRFGVAGAIIEPVAPPMSAAEIWEAWTTLRSWSVASGLETLYAQEKTRAHLKPAAIWEIERGRKLSAMEVQRASVIRSNWFKAAHELFQSYDALVLPSAQCWPFPIDWDWPKEIAGQSMDTYHRWMEVVIPVSLIGLPSVAVPLRPKPRPMGLQLFGPRGSDLKLLRLAQIWHQAL
ncbi:amidase [Cognatiyoonia sediminum]|uniref:Amidase n=1 Tax=Cognatiyoonia sediminum TaxID=1508389 RepID=A0A1M5LME4_9RHOB|nr:amidase [Cognatiyoonia sediminum]SHG65503.1 amidase [Cognatiyoonia sediminum]